MVQGALADDKVSLFKVITAKDEIVIGLTGDELKQMDGNAGGVAKALVTKGSLSVWKYAVRKAPTGDLEQAPHRAAQHAEGEDPLAAPGVAEMRHDDAAKRTREIADGEHTEHLHLAQPIRDLRREEHLPHGQGEEYEDDEIVELERPAESCERERPVVV